MQSGSCLGFPRLLDLTGCHIGLGKNCFSYCCYRYQCFLCVFEQGKPPLLSQRHWVLVAARVEDFDWDVPVIHLVVPG